MRVEEQNLLVLTIALSLNGEYRVLAKHTKDIKTNKKQWINNDNKAWAPVGHATRSG
jgi:hypothetical protein